MQQHQKEAKSTSTDSEEDSEYGQVNRMSDEHRKQPRQTETIETTAAPRKPRGVPEQAEPQKAARQHQSSATPPQQRWQERRPTDPCCHTRSAPRPLILGKRTTGREVCRQPPTMSLHKVDEDESDAVFRVTTATLLGASMHQRAECG